MGRLDGGAQGAEGSRRFGLKTFMSITREGEYRLKTGAPGSVLIWNPQPHAFIAAFNVLRIHSETVRFFAFAAALTRFTSSALNRKATIFPLASPLGSLGRPTFLGFTGGIGSELLNNKGSDSG